MILPDDSLTLRLAKHLMRPVENATRTQARLHLLDWLACVAGARQTEVAKRLDAIQDAPVKKSSFMGNVLEMDDVHRTALLHPGPVIWPAILQGETTDMEALLDAAVRGYEAMICVGATFDAHHYAHFHPTATAGIFGAAAATASLNGLDELDVANAMALAGSVTGGVWHMRHTQNMAKQWHVAHVVETGLSAAFYAAQGMNGPLAILEGPQGIYAAMTNAPKPMVFGAGWRISEVSFKPWAACRHAHPVIDCALELRAAGRLEAPFHIETYADAIAFCDAPNPTTEAQAKFSLQHSVAVIADGRDATPEDYTLEAIAALASLRAQVTVTETPEITARYPAHFGARVNGLELVDTRGDPERPVAQADIIAKMHMLGAWGGLPVSEAERAVELALNGNDPAAIVAMLGDWL